MTQHLPGPDERVARQVGINTLRPHTDGRHLREAIIAAIDSEASAADDEWLIVQVRPRITFEYEEPGEGTIVRRAFEEGDITLARYAGDIVKAASIRLGGTVITLEPGDVVHLHHGTCPCGERVLGPSFDPSTVPGLCELRARVARGTLSGDTERSPWVA